MVPAAPTAGTSPKVPISSILNTTKQSPPVLPVSSLRAPEHPASALPRRMEPPVPQYAAYPTPSPPNGTLAAFNPSPTFQHAYGPIPQEYHRPYLQQWPGASHMYAAYPYMPRMEHPAYMSKVPQPQPMQLQPPVTIPPVGAASAVPTPMSQPASSPVQPQAGRLQKGRRFRRRYYQIHRKYKCFHPGCTKSYGSLNHLNTHIVTKRHGQRKSKADFKHIEQEEEKESRSEEEPEEKEKEWPRPAEPWTPKGFTLPSLSISRETSGRLPSLPSIVGQCTFTA